MIFLNFFSWYSVEKSIAALKSNLWAYSVISIDNSTVYVHLQQRLLRLFEKSFFSKSAHLLLKNEYHHGLQKLLFQPDGVRFIFFEEPDHKTQTIDGNLLKAQTGSGETAWRKLYSKETKIKNVANIIVGCNKKPNCTAVDQAMIKRFIDFPNEATFT